MKEKTFNLLGLRKSVILYHTKWNNRITSEVIMRELTPDEEEQCEDSSLEYIHINDNVSIDKRRIVLYGEVDLVKDKDAILDFCYIPEYYDAHVHSNFNYEEGTFTTINGIAKSYITFDPILWFKYNYCLIGKPKKIIIYKKYAEH